MAQPTFLAPSILAADFSRLGEQIQQSVTGGADWIHCDIMDGHFVPNISYGPLIVTAARKSTDAFLDVHLMIYNPDQFIPMFLEAGAQLISVHVEAVPHLHRTIQLIKHAGCKAGVAINPGTSLSALDAILPYVDLVVVMSVNPGFGGQPFIQSTYERVRSLDAIRKQTGRDFLIEIDGGVGLSNAQALVSAGANVLVAGSSLFSAPDIAQRARELKQKMAV
jgi:ribulose-phosphate 3-epimerase